MGSEPTEIPRFAHSVFGYDRYQVEEYLGRLREWAMEAHERNEEAARLVAARDEEIQALQARIAEPAKAPVVTAESIRPLLAQALDELTELRRRAGEESARVIEAARGEALDIVRTAQQMAEKLLAEAEQDRAAAGDERRAAREELDVAKAERDSAKSDAQRIAADAEAEAAEIRRRAEELQDEAKQGQLIVEKSLSGVPDDLQRIVGSLDRLNQRLGGLSFEGMASDSREAE